MSYEIEIKVIKKSDVGQVVETRQTKRRLEDTDDVHEDFDCKFIRDALDEIE